MCNVVRERDWPPDAGGDETPAPSRGPASTESLNCDPEQTVTDHHPPAPLEDAHLLAALQEAEEAMDELEQIGARTAAAAWFGCVRTLRRFLSLPHCPPRRDAPHAP